MIKDVIITVMEIDSALAHYGLFQVVFADATEHVAQALFELRAPNEPNLKFSDVFGRNLDALLKELRKELSQFKDHGPSTQEHMQVVSAAVDRVNELKQWRNHRIHARVKVASDGWGLFDKVTGKRLVIDEIECEQNINHAVKAIVDFEAYIPHLQNAIAFQKEVRDDAKSLEGCEC